MVKLNFYLIFKLKFKKFLSLIKNLSKRIVSLKILIYMII